jgi:hypothetical protein
LVWYSNIVCHSQKPGCFSAISSEILVLHKIENKPLDLKECLSPVAFLLVWSKNPTIIGIEHLQRSRRDYIFSIKVGQISTIRFKNSPNILLMKKILLPGMLFLVI